MRKGKARVYVGTSGWHYKHWLGEFYPSDIKPSEYLNYYSNQFDSVELNNTFYRLPNRKVLESWRSGSPGNFLFSVKASRYITHQKKLNNVFEPLSTFLSHIDLLKNKLGPVLFQLPPSFKVHVGRFESFLKILPKDYRFVFEFRNETWFNDDIIGLMKDYQAGLCIYDLAGYRSPEIVTSNFVYIRLHGPGNKYEGLYHGNSIKAWARKIKVWKSRGYDVFCYFDNDQAAYATQNAGQLIKQLTK